MRNVQREGLIRGMGKAGEPGERGGRHELGFAAKLHSADDGGEVHIAAALAGAQQRSLNLHGSCQDGRAGVGHAKAAIGMAMEAELCFGMTGGKGG